MRTLARRMLEERQAQRAQEEARATAEAASSTEPPRDVGLLDYIPRITPRWERPDHLAVIADVFERARRVGNVFACVSVPPQHGKSELCLHAIPWWLGERPDDTLAYVTYSAELTRSKSRAARDYARAAGVPLRTDSNALHEWRTTFGGGLLATGIGGPLTGHGIQCLLVDDPFKNRQQAESLVYRNHVEHWLRSTGLSRRHPRTSCIVIHTRWHEDDLIGRLARDREIRWEVHNLPAIDDLGRPLWAKRRPLDFLEAQRALLGLYDFTALYLGRPQPRGGAVFHTAHYFDAAARPIIGYRMALGIDAAYTAKTHADWSVAVAMLEASVDGKRKYFIVDVLRRQLEAPKFFALVAAWLATLYRGAPARSYVAGAEKGVFDFARKAGVAVKTLPALKDKFTRALPFAAAWNRGDVLVAAEPAWAHQLVGELQAFTGVNDAQDDVVDACVAAYDELAGTPSGTGVETLGESITGGLRKH